MKTFAAATPALALVSSVFAKFPGDNGTLSDASDPLVLDEPVDIRFDDLSNYQTLDDGRDPVDTLIFSVSNIYSNESHILNLNVTGIRQVVPDIELSVRGCNWNGTICYPDSKVPNVHSQFDHDQLKGNNTIAKLDISKFATDGTFFFVYLQAQINPGKDNARPKNDTDTGSYDDPNFDKILADDDEYVNNIAMTLSRTHA